MNNTSLDLIIGYLKNTLDKEEIEQFYIWVNANQKNKKLFFETKTAFDFCVADNNKVDIHKSWERLLNKKERINRSVMIFFHWRTIARYSAIASIAILCTAIYFNLKDQTNIAVQYIKGNISESDIIILPDGTKVNLGYQSTFTYAPDYGEDKRIVYLDGEAFFDVAKVKNKPFILKVKDQRIEVLGTKFNVMAHSKDSILTTTLLEGSIQLFTDNNDSKITLKPNQQFTYNRNNQTEKVKIVDASKYVSWIDGYYYFSDQNMKYILDKLGTVYGVRFDIKSKELTENNFTGTFYRGQSVKEILEVINISIPINYEIHEDYITITN